MTFTSFNFLIFFPLVIIIYNLIPKTWRLWFLLVVSYVFYFSLQPIYTLLLAGVTISTYLFTKGIYSAKGEKKRRILQIWGIIITVLPLFFFKYFGFINNSISHFLTFVGWNISFPKVSLMLPVGISFYTFMAIGYIIDVYNEEVDFEPNWGSVGLFLSFFPLVLSGPIERAGNMLPQFRNLERSTYDNLVQGLKWMLWGYFMKLCVADRLGVYVDAIFNNIAQHNGTTLAFASILYPFQVYADLGGYSLIAIGVAKCFGLKVIPNFRRPFFSTSMSEFWRRWHMSLIQWITDYIYTPLSFALRNWKIWGIVAALILSFIISGIWHGAAMTFIVWGLIQGIFLSIEALLQKKRTKFETRFKLTKKWWYTFLCCMSVFILFAFSQIFGRCDSIDDAISVINKIFSNSGPIFIDGQTLANAGICLILLLVMDIRDEFLPGKLLLFENRHIVIRWASYIFVLVLILSLGVLDAGQFIYFQF